MLVLCLVLVLSLIQSRAYPSLMQTEIRRYHSLKHIIHALYNYDPIH